MSIMNPLEDCIVYIINLDRCPERWDHMQSVEWGFDRVERVPAVDISQMDDQERRKHVSSRALHYCRAGVKRSTEDINSWGPLGCYMSHIKALRKAYSDAIKSGSTYVLIMEDDVCWSPISNGTTVRSYLEDHFPPDSDQWDVWLIGMAPRDVQQWKSNGGSKRSDHTSLSWRDRVTPLNYISSIYSPSSIEWIEVRSFLQTHAIVYRTSCIPSILERVYPIEVHYDSFLSFLIQEGVICAISSNVPLLRQEFSFSSTIGHDFMPTIASLEQNDVWWALFGWIVMLVLILYVIYWLVRKILIHSRKERTRQEGKDFERNPLSPDGTIRSSKPQTQNGLSTSR